MEHLHLDNLDNITNKKWKKWMWKVSYKNSYLGAAILESCSFESCQLGFIFEFKLPTEMERSFTYEII